MPGSRTPPRAPVCRSQRTRRSWPIPITPILRRTAFPALRLIAGFNAPDSNLRLVLTAADTRDKVRPEELDQALRIATTLTWQALAAADATLLSLRAGRGSETAPTSRRSGTSTQGEPTKRWLRSQGR